MVDVMNQRNNLTKNYQKRLDNLLIPRSKKWRLER